jgi:hypothetical protein
MSSRKSLAPTSPADWELFINLGKPRHFLSARRDMKMIYNDVKDNTELLAFLRSGCRAASAVFLSTMVFDKPRTVVCGVNKNDDAVSLDEYNNDDWKVRTEGRDIRASETALRFVGMSDDDIQKFDLETLFTAAQFELSPQQVIHAREHDIDYELMRSM